MEYLQKILKKSGWISLVESVIFAIIGIVLMQNPEGTVKVITYVLGAIFILAGIYKIVEYLYEKGRGGLYSYNIVYGLMAVVIGIVTMVFSGTIGALFRIIIGIWIIYSSLLRMTTSFRLRAVDTNIWIVSLTLSIIMLICGIYVIVNSGAIVATIGLFILIYSIIDIIENLIFLKNVDSIK